MTGYPETRAKISIEEGKVTHTMLGQANPCRVVLRRDMISVGCTDMTVEAAEFLIAEYKKAFPHPEVFVLQP